MSRDPEPDKKNVTIAPSDIIQSGRCLVKFLRNPKTSLTSPYVVANKKFYEILKWNDSCTVGSWFYGEQVVSDPSMFVLSPMDVNFFYLRCLASSKKKQNFQSLDTILSDDDISSQKTILKESLSLASIDLYADSKKVDGEFYYKFNQEKALNWLEEKVKSIRSQLQLFNKEAPEDHILRSAVELICDYIPADVEEAIRTKLNIPVQEDEPNTVPIFAGMVFGRSKEGSLDEGAQAPESKKSKLSSGQQKLLKADKTGMKSITSFFTKK